MELDNNNHSVFLLHYHLVLVVKYRRKVFSEAMSRFAKDIFVRIGASYHITLEEWNHDIDHVYVIFRAEPRSEISKFINAYKSASSRLLKKEYPQIEVYEDDSAADVLETIFEECNQERFVFVLDEWDFYFS